MANFVSVLQQEEEPLYLNTLHGVVLAGDLERLKAMEKGETDLNILGVYASQLGTAKNAILIQMWYPFVMLHTSLPRGGSGHVALVRELELLRVGADWGDRVRG